MSEERRVVTILFSDVTGSTAMGESSDPEDVRAILGRYYAIAREVIGAHGGTVEKFIGDAVMAVFGIPQAHGDDAERALVAALALREAVANDVQTAALALRIGVNTGEVVAAKRSDTADFLVTGDAVNVAARLQQHAEPGAIMVGERTRRAVTGFSFGEERSLEVKGKREAIEAAALLERKSSLRAPLGAFVGRAHDLAQLDLVSRRAFAERRPQLVTITAPAGTGKSRLVEEFARRMDGARMATAQCLPYGAAVTFIPLRGLVRDLLGAETADDIHSRVNQAFLDAGQPPEDAARLTTMIAATLGDEARDERRDRDEVFGAWRLLLEAMAVKGPLVAVFEDLHWASDTLLDLVEHMTLSRVTAPLVIFALARPELIDRKPQWGGGRRNFSSIALEPLDETETRALVAGITDGASGAIAERIVERSGGNPFFAGELARAYRERRSEGTRDADIVLPDTVHATVLARIDGLSPDERQILELAAVVGRTARAATIHALLPERDEPAIARLMEALAQRDMLVPQGADTYTFRHIVIREVAYATLPRAQRVKVHLRLARWLEEATSNAPNERAELVAYHYRQAIALSPGGRVPEGLEVARVVAVLERAARAASSLGAVREAGEQLREAIRLAAPSDHLRLLELRGDVLLFGSDAIETFAEAFRLWSATPGGDPLVGARLLAKELGIAGRWVGSLARPLSQEEFAQLEAQAQRLAPADEDIGHMLMLARAFAILRWPAPEEVLREIREGVQRAYEYAQRRDDADAMSVALDALAAILRFGYGEFEKAFDVTMKRLPLAPKLTILERADTVAILAWDLTLAGRYEEVVASFPQWRRILRPGEPEYIMSHCVSWVVYAAMLCGQWDQALEAADHLLAIRDEAAQIVGRFSFQGWIGALRVASARIDTTRVARYRSALVAIGNPAQLDEPLRSQWNAFIDNDAASARRFLVGPRGTRERRAEMIALMVFDLDDVPTEAELALVESQAQRDPGVLTLRIQLARAMRAGTAQMREAVAALARGHLVADAARAATLLALRTGEAADRADAKRRLEALGDRVYLQKLAEA
jgi:class 3 adenylate cyclase